METKGIDMPSYPQTPPPYGPDPGASYLARPYPDPPGHANPAGSHINIAANPVIHNTNQIAVNVGGLQGESNWRSTQNIREWSSGLCGCCGDCCSCCYSFWCFPCFMCSLSAKLDEYPCGPCMCLTNFMVAMRTKARTLFGIRGSICGDTCAVCCCPCCAMTQIWRELENVGI